MGHIYYDGERFTFFFRVCDHVPAQIFLHEELVAAGHGALNLPRPLVLEVLVGLQPAQQNNKHFHYININLIQFDPLAAIPICGCRMCDLLAAIPIHGCRICDPLVAIPICGCRICFPLDAIPICGCRICDPLPAIPVCGCRICDSLFSTAHTLCQYAPRKGEFIAQW